MAPGQFSMTEYYSLSASVIQESHLVAQKAVARMCNQIQQLFSFYKKHLLSLTVLA